MFAAAPLEKVMVVDDEPMIRRLVFSVLSCSGYQVVDAATAQRAIELMEDAPVDLLLTDVVMPDLSGCELARQLQILQPSLKVLYMSGYDPDSTHMELDGNTLIRKPFRIAELVNHVKRTLLTV